MRQFIIIICLFLVATACWGKIRDECTYKNLFGSRGCHDEPQATSYKPSEMPNIYNFHPRDVISGNNFMDRVMLPERLGGIPAFMRNLL
jgi:hypothetical protein